MVIKDVDHYCRGNDECGATTGNKVAEATVQGDQAYQIIVFWCPKCNRFFNCHGVEMEHRYFIAGDGTRYSSRTSAVKRNEEMAKQKETNDTR